MFVALECVFGDSVKFTDHVGKMTDIYFPNSSFLMMRVLSDGIRMRHEGKD